MSNDTVVSRSRRGCLGPNPCGSETAPRQFPGESASRLAPVAKEQLGDHAERADPWPSSLFQTSDPYAPGRQAERR
jgi:hypothetical protein